MLDASLKTQLQAYLERLTRPVHLVASLDDGDSSAQMLQLLQDIHNQSYVHPVSADYQKALGAFMPVPCRGYQSAPAFSRLVRTMLARTQDIGLGHSVVRLDTA